LGSILPEENFPKALNRMSWSEIVEIVETLPEEQRNAISLCMQEKKREQVQGQCERYEQWRDHCATEEDDTGRQDTHQQEADNERRDDTVS